MRKILSIALSASLLSACCACDTNHESADAHPGDSDAVYQTISADRAKALMDSGESYILLDVRTDEEFADKHIDGAVLIPDYEIKSRAESELPDKGAAILVYCRSGRRSAGAARELADMGYTNVYDFGGIIDWPYETVKGA
jgi:rhodanese-related sulfurtransferase